jgi:hypothetical protein
MSLYHSVRDIKDIDQVTAKLYSLYETEPPHVFDKFDKLLWTISDHYEKHILNLDDIQISKLFTKQVKAIFTFYYVNKITVTIGGNDVRQRNPTVLYYLLKYNPDTIVNDINRFFKKAYQDRILRGLNTKDPNCVKIFTRRMYKLIQIAINVMKNGSSIHIYELPSIYNLIQECYLPKLPSVEAIAECSGVFAPILAEYHMLIIRKYLIGSSIILINSLLIGNSDAISFGIVLPALLDIGICSNYTLKYLVRYAEPNAEYSDVITYVLTHPLVNYNALIEEMMTVCLNKESPTSIRTLIAVLEHPFVQLDMSTVYPVKWKQIKTTPKMMTLSRILFLAKQMLSENELEKLNTKKK